MASKPSLGLLLPAQALGATAEIFGQREVRVIHGRSTIRAMIAISLYSGLEALVVLSFCQLLLPESVTDNQVRDF